MKDLGMRTVALLTRKGGSGKTTCAIHMGVLAQQSGLRVLFFDLDPQRSLATWWRSREDEAPGLVETDARRFAELLKRADTDGYDLAVVDTPPAVSFDTAKIAALADLALVPLRPSILDIYAVASTVDVVRATKTPTLLVLNACPAPREMQEAATTLEARKALTDAGQSLATVSLAQRLDYTRALNGGEAVNEFAPASKAAQEMRQLWDEVQRKLR